MTTFPPRRTPYFVAGGTLGPHIPSYVKRPTDDELFERVVAGELCYVLTPRQMGKSSLVARTMVRLRDEKIGAVAVDLQDSGGLDEDTFYLNILDELHRAFQLDVAIEAWWDENGRLGASLRFRRFFTDHLLPQTAGRGVIFIDEIDTMLTMPFRDNFFAAIRALFNGRADNPELERLTFVLLGVASPSELIKDPDRTPFNIGTKINLQEFKPTDAEPLLKGLENVHPQQAKAILERIFYWTSGHPYLTQQLCLLITQTPERDWHDAEIDALVRQTFLSDEARNEDNIKLIQGRISASPNKRRLLRLYRQVYRGQIVKENKASFEQNQLLLSGLVSLTNGQLQVRNQIYHNVFDQKWIQRETEINWGVVIGATGGIIALLAILALLYNSVLLPNQQRNFELNFLQATSAEEQADALAGLASIRPLPLIGDATIYEQSVRELFFGIENWEQQKSIYDHHHFRENSDKLIRMIKIVYTSMVDADQSGHTTPMLAHMANNLEDLGKEDEDITNLQQEIFLWVQGRILVENNELERALQVYNIAITSNPNNPATLFERARILTEIGNTSTDQTVSEENYSLALEDLDRVVSFILLQPEPEVGEILATSTATQPPTATKTTVPTNTASPTVISFRTSSTPNPPTLESPSDITTIPTVITSPTATLRPTQPPPPTLTPGPLPSQFNTRSQWLNLIRDFLRSEPALTNILVSTRNPENIYPNLMSSSLIETPIPSPIVSATIPATTEQGETLTPTSTLPAITPETTQPELTPTPSATPDVELRILWTDDCDPRTSDNFCQISSSLEILAEFYEVIDSINGTLVYEVPESEQDLEPYAVVIVDFCSPASNTNSIDAIKQYILSGGSAFIMGGNFCFAGENYTAWYASQLTQDFGVTFTSDDDTSTQGVDSIAVHPIVVDVEDIYVWRHAYLNVQEPSRAIASINGQPILAVYDGTGTFVALSDEGFEWGASTGRTDISASDNFILWKNVFNWLIEQAQIKR